MREFLLNNWFIIVVGICLVEYIVYLAVKRRWIKLRELAYNLILQAEKAITGTKMGQERFGFVLSQLYSMIPTWLRFFIPRSLLERKLQEWFDLIKDSLDDGKVNGTGH
ncbi:hypothetical protein [Ruminiclostridium josui]|uniref:hypothetical protein n=1 Tax=Ruminiclostridium josui TaxID=1499 RepID=UPI0004B0EBC2|nr:hypothetical protein [Ruminiclostridium josui]